MQNGHIGPSILQFNAHIAQQTPRPRVGRGIMNFTLESNDFKALQNRTINPLPFLFLFVQPGLFELGELGFIIVFLKVKSPFVVFFTILSA